MSGFLGASTGVLSVTIRLTFLRMVGGLVEDLDRVVVALGHLLAVEAGHHGDAVQDVGLGQAEHVFAAAINAVEPLGDVAGDLQVLLLVLAHRHKVGVVEQDVGRLEHGIGKKAVIGGEPLLHLVLEAHGLLQPAHGRDRGEQPGQLGRLGHVRLDEERGLLRIQPQGQEIDEHVEDILTHPGRVAHAGQRVVIGDEVIGLVALLKRDVLADGAEVVADVQSTRRLNSRQDPHGRHHSHKATRGKATR